MRLRRFWSHDRYGNRVSCRLAFSRLKPAAFLAQVLVRGIAPTRHKDGARIFSTHSLRATIATLLLDTGVDIRKVRELLGHRHVTTTQIYDKRWRTTEEIASHDVPI